MRKPWPAKRERKKLGSEGMIIESNPKPKKRRKKKAKKKLRRNKKQ